MRIIICLAFLFLLATTSCVKNSQNDAKKKVHLSLQNYTDYLKLDTSYNRYSSTLISYNYEIKATAKPSNYDYSFEDVALMFNYGAHMMYLRSDGTGETTWTYTTPNFEIYPEITNIRGYVII